jgi:hypothetical protein
MQTKIFCAFRNTNDDLYCKKEGCLLEEAMNNWFKNNPHIEIKDKRSVIADDFFVITLFY